MIVGVNMFLASANSGYPKVKGRKTVVVVAASAKLNSAFITTLIFKVCITYKHHNLTMCYSTVIHNMQL